MSAATLRVVYGDRVCCATGDYEVTATDARGTVAYRTCDRHRDACVATAATFVASWAPLTVTIGTHPAAATIHDAADLFDGFKS